jgi:hypothetical protein
MSDTCCPPTPKPKPTKSKQEFLSEKAKNFRTWLLSFECDEEVKVYVNAFDETLLIPTIQTVLVPLVRKGGIPSAAKDLAKKVNVPAEGEEAFCKKFQAYCEMFVEVVDAQ